MFIVARQVEQLLGSRPEIARFQLVVNRRDNRDEISLNLETKDSPLNTVQFSAEINQKFQDTCRLKLDHIGFVLQGVIPEPHKTIEDIRKWE
jgi:phenylacetate-coenzyme A ligase PaaK-like adenylate-forming protein